MPAYEVEIKCLLGGRGFVEGLVERMKEQDPNFCHLESHQQLNHYFTGGNLRLFYEKVQEFIGEDKRGSLKSLAEGARDFSLRTRQADEKVILVLKVSVDEGTSANTIGRIEFEAETPLLTLEELDALVLESGFECQAKWSRERSVYRFLDVNTTIDKNAGYGYLAEFEMVVDGSNKVDKAKAKLRKLVRELNLEELPQDRLERMFAYYNAHWQDYYGTDRVFVIE